MAVDSGTYTPETVARKQKLAEMLLGESMKPQKITHWAEGLAQLGRAGVGGYIGHQAEQEARAGEAAQTQALARLLGGDTSAPAPISAPAAPTDDYAQRIAGIESGGNYNALGPETKGDRAYGKYQVMGANVPAWTKAHLGQEMTPEDFLKNPQAQDAVFKGQFGQYASKYGPEGAAKAWFAGEGGMNNPNARDVLGTSVADYAKKFNGANPVAAALAGQTQLAQAQPPAQGSDQRSKISAMLSDANPYVRKMGQSLAQGIIQKQIEGEKPTDEMREYDLYRRQGGKDSFFDYKAGLKKAGAQNISIDQRGEDSFAKAAAGVQAKRFDELASEAPKAKQMLSDVQVLTDLGKNIGTGKAAEVKAALGPYADALGIKIDKLDDIQAFEAVVNRMAPNLRVPGSGAQSDFELKNFLKSLPNLGNTEGGNEIASTVMQGLYQNKVTAAEIGSQALTGEISRPEAEKRLRNLPDPLIPYREFMKTNRGAPSASGSPDAGWKDLGGGVRIREKK